MHEPSNTFGDSAGSEATLSRQPSCHEKSNFDFYEVRRIGVTMSFWNIFGKMAVSDEGETIQKLSDTFSVSSEGVTYTTMGNFTTGSDGSSFTKMGSFSSDGSTRIGNTATGLGSVFDGEKDV
jgi:hypothetical protein